MGRPQQFLVEKKVPHGLAAGIMIFVLILTYFEFMTLIGSSISMFVERAPEYGENLKIESTPTKPFFKTNNFEILQKRQSIVYRF